MRGTPGPQSGLVSDLGFECGMEIIRLTGRHETKTVGKALGSDLCINEEKNAEPVAEAPDPPDLLALGWILGQKWGGDQHEGGGEAGARGRANGNDYLREGNPGNGDQPPLAARTAPASSAYCFGSRALNRRLRYVTLPFGPTTYTVRRM